MVTNAITPLPTPAPSTSDPVNFNPRADALLTALPTFVTEANAYGAYLQAAVAASMTPGGISIPYTFSTTTTDSDPGAGVIRFSSATQNASTVLRPDLVDGVGTTQTTVLDSLDDSTSTVKGYLRITKVGDASKWLLWTLSSIATPTGYRNLTVAIVAGSAASPFADGDLVLVTFTPKGDKGDQGIQGPTAQWSNFSTQSITVGVNVVSFTQAAIASAKSLKFIIDGVTSANDILNIAFRRGGANWSSGQQIQAAATGRTGLVTIEGVRLDIQTTRADLNTTTMTDGQVNSVTPSFVMERNNGGIDGVRFSMASVGNNMTGGNISGWAD